MKYCFHRTSNFSRFLYVQSPDNIRIVLESGKAALEHNQLKKPLTDDEKHQRREAAQLKIEAVLPTIAGEKEKIEAFARGKMKEVLHTHGPLLEILGSVDLLKQKTKNVETLRSKRELYFSVKGNADDLTEQERLLEERRSILEKGLRSFEDLHGKLKVEREKAETLLEALRVSQFGDEEEDDYATKTLKEEVVWLQARQAEVEQAALQLASLLMGPKVSLPTDKPLAEGFLVQFDTLKNDEMGSFKATQRRKEILKGQQKTLEKEIVDDLQGDVDPHTDLNQFIQQNQAKIEEIQRVLDKMNEELKTFEGIVSNMSEIRRQVAQAADMKQQMLEKKSVLSIDRSALEDYTKKFNDAMATKYEELEQSYYQLIRRLQIPLIVILEGADKLPKKSPDAKGEDYSETWIREGIPAEYLQKIAPHTPPADSMKFLEKLRKLREEKIAVASIEVKGGIAAEEFVGTMESGRLADVLQVMENDFDAVLQHFNTQEPRYPLKPKTGREKTAGNFVKRERNKLPPFIQERRDSFEVFVSEQQKKPGAVTQDEMISKEKLMDLQSQEGVVENTFVESVVLPILKMILKNADFVTLARSFQQRKAVRLSIHRIGHDAKDFEIACVSIGKDGYEFKVNHHAPTQELLEGREPFMQLLSSMLKSVRNKTFQESGWNVSVTPLS